MNKQELGVTLFFVILVAFAGGMALDWYAFRLHMENLECDRLGPIWQLEWPKTVQPPLKLQRDRCDETHYRLIGGDEQVIWEGREE